MKGKAMTFTTFKNDPKFKTAFVADVGLCQCGCGQRTNLAPFSDRRIGWVRGKPLKYIKNHYRPGPAKFEYRITDSGCWMWAGAKNKAGYGVTWQDGKAVGAHRVAYEREYGSIPTGLVVLHSCDVPACVNPAHLSVGTSKMNTQDAVQKGRMARGERQHSAKLTDDAVREIRLKASTTTIAALSREYQVSEKALTNAIRRITWKHVL